MAVLQMHHVTLVQADVPACNERVFLDHESSFRQMAFLSAP